jgi:hypothetical protein
VVKPIDPRTTPPAPPNKALDKLAAINSSFIKDGLITPAMLNNTTLGTPFHGSGVMEKLIDSGKRYTVSTPRTSGKSFMSDLMIPGFNSEDAGLHSGGHQAYVDELLFKHGKPPKYGTLKTPIRMTGQGTPIRQYQHESLTPFELEDQMAAIPAAEVDPQLKALVDRYEAAFAESPQSFSLSAPQKLITQKGKDFRHTAFIGGEEFMPVSARLGAKGQTLILFRPVDPSDFEYMELPEAGCVKAFGATFSTYLRETLADVLEEKGALDAAQRTKVEQERNAANYETYGEFGSW